MRDPQAQLCKMPISELKRHVAFTGCAIDRGSEKAEVVQRLLNHSRNSVVAALWASDARATPSCVCGSVLYRVYGSARAQQSAEKVLKRMGIPTQTPQYNDTFERVFKRLTCKGNCGDRTCDLCYHPVKINGGVWTCRNADGTILHASEYEVCDNCFVNHTSDAVTIGKAEMRPAQSVLLTTAPFMEHFTVGVFSVACSLLLVGFRKFCSFQKQIWRLKEPLMQP
eukprot:gnl/MRDRNA2_/MRDRNA2_73476_c0_seq1.p1 gnl/MRDRNA2_/MRDRNA2_73476_c0~~gnl/MRDRNA2_/MRDRNA2_73476_c0_seq1.p1  ORF type:complete len:225 (+),score=32.42 gnl/MRDRNA2_/MRDRNA2_73476_c0_seq1:495-1169(+)